MPPGVATSKLTPQQVNTHAGLKRDKFPGAGAITHFYGIGSQALRDVPAGSEMSKCLRNVIGKCRLRRLLQSSRKAIDYGDFTYEKGKTYEAPMREVGWLRQHGMCIDNIRIGPSTNPQAGRGAFASRSLRAGQLISPAPLQTYVRDAFVVDGKESILVNYCFQPQGSDIMLFPYGQPYQP